MTVQFSETVHLGNDKKFTKEKSKISIEKLIKKVYMKNEKWVFCLWVFAFSFE